MRIFSWQGLLILLFVVVFGAFGGIGIARFIQKNYIADAGLFAEVNEEHKKATDYYMRVKALAEELPEQDIVSARQYLEAALEYLTEAASALQKAKNKNNKQSNPEFRIARQQIKEAVKFIKKAEEVIAEYKKSTG